MTMIRLMMRACLYLGYGFQKLTGTGVFAGGGAGTVALTAAATGNRLKDALVRHHVTQFHESSCSVASVVSALNAILDASGLPGREPVTQAEILETVREAHWKERMEEGGYRGKKGLPLHTLGQVVRAALNAYGLSYVTVETVQAPGDPRQSRVARSQLLARLGQFETRGNCLIIAHFDQGSYVPELHIPHISPVGGFDPGTRQVTILDVDPSQPHFYTVSFDRFYRGLSTRYYNLFMPFGYGRGGYVFIQIP